MRRPGKNAGANPYDLVQELHDCAEKSVPGAGPDVRTCDPSQFQPASPIALEGRRISSGKLAMKPEESHP
jgi:hypothetical protein